MSERVSLKNKLAFGAADIFGGGSFNVINFLFTAFLSLVVGIPMFWVSFILLVTKLFDGVIDPFIGTVTDGKKANKFGKRRYFMLIFAPVMLVCFVLLFFPWNLVTTSLPLKITFVIIVYVLYAFSQSFILIPYYSLSSEMTDDFVDRNRVSATRIAFSVLSSLVCVAVPGTIANPSKAATDGGVCYIVMAVIFGTIFCLSVLVCALFAREQVITPPVKRKVQLKNFFKPLKMKTYRNYLGMQICASMAMAIISSFFFIYCDFYLRSDTYLKVTTMGLGRFPIATVAAACMFVAQAAALPFYLKVVEKNGKQFAYVLSASMWIVLLTVLLCLPPEQAGSAVVVGNSVKSVSGTPDWVIIAMGFLMGFALGGCVYVPHSSVGDVCNAGQLVFGERTEGAFSGLTNFLNTTAQAIGLAIPPFIMGFAGYAETKYISVEEYLANQSAFDAAYKVTQGQNVQLVPLTQTTSAQLAIKITITVLPIAILLVAIVFAKHYKLTQKVQEEIVAYVNEQKGDRNEILAELGENVKQ